MKKLHRMILRSLPGPFLASLGCIMFLLVMQFLMRHLRDLVGKGLSISVIAEILIYNLAYMVVLAVPMSVLIATLFVFARLSESRAYRVIKSSGVSIVQLLWPVWLVATLLVGAMTYFNNVLLPESNYRAKTLWYDIRQKKPGFALEPGVFYEGISGYAIRAMELGSDTNTMEGVTVFDYSDGGDRRSTVSASRGEIGTTSGGQRIELILEDGEIHRYLQGGEERYERLRFGRTRLPLDASELSFERSDPTSTSRSDRTTRTAVMIRLVDSLEAEVDRRTDALLEQLRSNRSWNSATLARSSDRDASAPAEGTWIAATKIGSASIRQATETVRRKRSDIQNAANTLRWLKRRSNRSSVEIHKKFSIAVACLVFVLVGAPLGLRVLRGGLGTVAGMATGIFLFYWITLVQGEKLADRGFIDPWVGMWAANVVIGAAAIMAIVAAARDAGRRGWNLLPWLPKQKD